MSREDRLTLAVTALVIASAACAACSSLFHFTSPAAQGVTCEVSDALLPQLEAAAAAFCGPVDPVCLAAIETVFGDACSTAAQTGASQADATKAGVEAVQAFARRAAAKRAELAK